MYNITTIPSARRLSNAEAETLPYMRPNQLPTAVIVEGYLDGDQCDAISAELEDLEPYSFAGCGAMTRECPLPLNPVLDPMIDIAKVVNQAHWQFDLDEGAAAWMQTYVKGGQYAQHTDGAPGQMRKLSAVAFLTDPAEYAGGNLWIRIEPRTYITSRVRGSVVVFPSWVPHYVDPVTRGTRQTINAGFWGPNFR